MEDEVGASPPVLKSNQRRYLSQRSVKCGCMMYVMLADV